jgi:hypothetical protein
MAQLALSLLAVVFNCREMAMRAQGLKALIAILNLKKVSNKRFNVDRAVLILTTAVTIGLVAIYVFEKVASR